MQKPENVFLAILTGVLLGLGLWELLEGRPQRTDRGLERDARKLRGDWERIGKDLQRARRRHDQEAFKAA